MILKHSASFEVLIMFTNGTYKLELPSLDRFFLIDLTTEKCYMLLELDFKI